MGRALLVILSIGIIAADAEAATLRVRVTEPQGSSLPGVAVTLDGNDAAPHLANVDGVAVFDAVEPGIHRVKAEIDGLTGVETNVRVMPEGSAVTLVLTFDGGTCCMVWTAEPPAWSEWKGKVVDDELRPLEGVEVECAWPDGRALARSEASGAFRCRVPGKITAIRLQLSKAGYETRRTSVACWRNLTLQLSSVPTAPPRTAAPPPSAAARRSPFPPRPSPPRLPASAAGNWRR